MMATLKERQIEIWSKEREIFDQTNELLTDVLHSLSPKQSKLLKGYNVDEYRKIVKIISPIDIKIEEEFGGKKLFSQEH